MGEQPEWEVVVIGAGAAGLLAAERAAKRGRRTLLLEKNHKLGVKILISGGTRCNITHHADVSDIASAFPKRQGQFLRSALAALPPSLLLEILEREGVVTKIEANGKIFPVSDRAIDVRDAFVRMLRRTDCEIRPGSSVLGIGRQGDGFQLELSSGPVVSRRIIIACGGRSYPGCGTTGDGYTWARQLGHRVVTPVPALTPVHSPDRWVWRLAGVTLPDVLLTAVDRSLGSDPAAMPKKAVIDTRRGSLLFTHFGLSGPAALDISRAVTRSADASNLVLVANFTPERSYEECLQRLREESLRDGKRQVNSVLAEWVPRRLALTLLVLGNVEPTRKLAELSKREQMSLVASLTRCPINVSGTSGFRKAEVTAGGVALDEMHSKTMESKLVPNCFFAGEVLDIDGPIGGYNFQAAFSTGWLAGSSV